MHRFSDATTRLFEGSDGSVYGTTRTTAGLPGRSSEVASVFKLDADETLTTLYRFTDVGIIWDLIQGADRRLYGTSDFGGGFQGIIFRLDAPGTRTTLYTFGREDSSPKSLIHDEQLFRDGLP